MKYLFLSVLLLFALPNAASAKGFDLEGLEWGMSPHELTEVKGTGMIEALGDRLVYVEWLEGQRYYVYYYFTNFELSQIEYVFKGRSAPKDGYVDYYYTVEAYLRSLCGEPDDRKVAFALEEGKDFDPERYLQNGYIRYFTWWNFETMTIQLSLEKPEEEPVLKIVVFKNDEKKA